MQKYMEQVAKYIDDHREELIAVWKDVVNLEGQAYEVDNMKVVAQRFKEEFEKTGMDCKLVDVGEQAGPFLVGVLGADRPGKPVMFSGHFDTVFKKGAFGENPFRIEGDKAYGPGVLDMKGGIIISLYVIKALNSIGWNERPIKIIYAPDEEVGHHHSSGVELYKREGAGGICAFNMETGRIDNQICIGRKGAMFGTVTVTGVESHAGNDFPSGRNAIAEMAHKIIELQKLTNLEAGTTVSCDIINGGTVINCIPGQCTLRVDMRCETVAEMERIQEEVKKICAKTYIEGTSTEVEIRVVMAPFEKTERGMAFHRYVNEISMENGWGEMGAVYLGGGSDAAYLTIAGTPTICGFGVRGEWNHTDREYALVESMFERSKLIAAIIMNLERFQA